MSSGEAAGSSPRQAMRIVLLGDLHTYRLAVWPWELLGKSLAGQMNLWLNRRKRFDRSLIQPTIERAISLKPDLVLMSGDLTTTSRPGEFADIAHALQPMMRAAPTVLVPGNHDVYTFTSKRRDRIRQTFPDVVPQAFPCVKPLIGGWRMLIVESAQPRVIDSRGRIGEWQLREVETILRSMSRDAGVIVLCHYPFGKPPEMPPMKTGHRLLDDDRWRQVIGKCPARLVLVHGHVHCPWLWRVSGMTNVLDVNAGAPTMVRGTTAADANQSGKEDGSAASAHQGHFGGARGQGFWEMTLPRDAAQPIAFAHHVMDDGAGSGGSPPVSGLSAAWSVDAEPREVDDPKWIIRHIEVR